MNRSIRVDMSQWGGRTNTFGFSRNSAAAFRQLARENPYMFSNKNFEAVKAGIAPTVDQRWVTFNPSHASFAGDRLNIHHINQMRFGTPLPESVHLRPSPWYNALHPFVLNP